MTRSDEKVMAFEGAAFDLLFRLHEETSCGDEGQHWPQCSALVQVAGYQSWEAWREAADHI